MHRGVLGIARTKAVLADMSTRRQLEQRGIGTLAAKEGAVRHFCEQWRFDWRLSFHFVPIVRSTITPRRWGIMLPLALRQGCSLQLCIVREALDVSDPTLGHLVTTLIHRLLSFDTRTTNERNATLCVPPHASQGERRQVGCNLHYTTLDVLDP